MEWMTFLLKGLLIGFVAVIPPGAVALVCIQRTLSKRRRSGFVSGLGSATVDGFYAVVAVFFLGMVIGFLERHIELLKVVGGLAAIIVGMTILLKNPVTQIRRNRSGRQNLWGDYASAAGISIANPAFMLMLLALLATLGIGGRIDSARAGVALVGGIVLGETVWWGVLTLGVGLLRKGFRPRHLLWLNRISGTAIVLFGVIAILSLAKYF
jgi:threonine/homoserine/homoserine lactone efflux protein